MGQTVEFYAGDPEIIGKAFSESDFDALRDTRIVPLRVDFSIHLSPVDFDELSVEVDKCVDTESRSLVAALESNVGGDPPGSSADIVAVDWVYSIASLPDDNVDGVVTSWASALSRKYDNAGIVATPEWRVAFRSLVEFCREALRLGIPVVHAWSL